jgi:integrase
MPVKISDALAEFNGYLAGRGLAAGTVKRHMVCARGFAATCQKVKGKNATMGQVDHECVAKYFAQLGGAQGYRNNALETVRKFLDWAEKWGYLRPGYTTGKLLDGYKSRKAERQPKYYLEAAEFPAALEAAGSHNAADRAVIAVALYTLARQSEIRPAQLRDLDLTKLNLSLFREKRQRWTQTGICPEFNLELETWLKAYAQKMGYLSPVTMIREHPDWLLIPSKKTWHGGGFRYQPDIPICAMERVAKRTLTDLGVTGTRDGKSVSHLGEGMHTIRRSGARAMLKNLSEGLGHQRALVQVSVMLDHDDLKQTLRYIGMDQEKDELNDWLRGNSPYGKPPAAIEAAVLKFRRPA